jgi:hypothetical protein
MRLGALSLFTRTNTPGCINIAAWHSRRSLTWSWVLNFRRFRADEWRVFPLWGGHGRWGHDQWFVRIPWLGIFHWHRQERMPHRDAEALSRGP